VQRQGPAGLIEVAGGDGEPQVGGGLLQRSPSMLLIPGTRSAAHLRENFAAAGLELPAEAVSKLNSIGTTQRSVPWGQR
jgi:pyridoxine 4-dehydrogenase